MDTQKSAKYFGVAPLNDQQLQELLALEQELGVVIIALKPTVPLADLTADQISRLQQFEQRHGVIALACRT